MQVSQSEHFTVVSHKRFVLVLLHFSSNYRTLLWLQQMLLLAVFTLMESHLLYMLMHRQITKIICTVRVVPLVPEKLVLS